MINLVFGDSNKKLRDSFTRTSGVNIFDLDVRYFPNGECKVMAPTELKEMDQIFLVLSTSSPVDTNIVKILFTVDSLKRLGVKKVVAVVPWFGYSPQDKIFEEGESLSSKVIINILEKSGVNALMTLDIHSEKISEMFSIPYLNFSSARLFADYVREKYIQDSTEWVVASPDKGGKKRAEEFAKYLGLPVIYFDKSRDLRTGEVTFHSLEGDPSGKKVVSFDDYLSTGGTLFKSADFLKEKGAISYFACITHCPVESTISKVKNSNVDKLISTNSIDFEVEQEKFEIVDISEYLLDAIKLWK